MKLAGMASTALPVVACRATSIGKVRVVRLPTAAAGPPPGHGWPRTKTQCWLMVNGALVTTRCHGRHGSSHSTGVGRPSCSLRAAQCSGAYWTWDLVVRLALPAKLVPTLDAVAYTSTSRSGLA
jgi:hypothetical protein